MSKLYFDRCIVLTKRKVCFILDDDDYKELKGVAENSGIKVSELLRILVRVFNLRLKWIVEEGRRFNDYYQLLIEKGVSPSNALENTIDLLIDYGDSFRNIVLGLLEHLKAQEHELRLIDAGWLKEYKGLFFHLAPTIYSKHLFDDLLFQIQENWDGYMYAVKRFSHEDYGAETFIRVIWGVLWSVGVLRGDGALLRAPQDRSRRCVPHAVGDEYHP